ncbi:VanZ family protein [Neobacillus sp. PS3-40]|uniref:VanZ family protein n=1 Tax=Neobacillus sp. PS3-40 TaxID=3070679 RepID=UPI0027E16EEE|nr:VanZ family protein [Neobacillus sp. PS3-40]WML46178.1 VanZ family protein [Neobacillus sp. PS3-40]
MEPYRIPVMGNSFKKNRKFLLKIALILLWGLFLSLNTWTVSLEHLIAFQSASFKWVWSPNFLSFFYFYDFTLIHPDFLLVKLGHFMGFAIMDLLVFNLFKRHKISISISITYAFLTEFLQLFFGRDGRLYDLGIDSLGVLSIYFFIQLFKLTGKQ